MKFAFLTELYFPHVGGQEVFFQELAEAMVRRGHEVDVHCIGHEPGLTAVEMLNGVRVCRHTNRGRYMSPKIAALRRDWTDIAKFSADVRRIAARGEHDFILMNQWPLMHIPALPRKIRERSAVHWCEIREDRLFTVLQSQLPKWVGMNFAVSEAVAAAIRKQSGRDCGVLPSGIVAARYRSVPRADRSGVLYVGRIAPHKNLTLLIDAFALAAARGLAGDLVIAGNGPAREDIASYAARSSVASRIRVLGSVDEAEKIELLAHSALLGMPSRREGFPRVIAEAMASGTPVVTADFIENGGRDVVRQYGAGIVCGTEAADFADAMVAATATDSWDGFSEAGIRGAKSLDWNQVAETLEKYAGSVAGIR